MIPFVFVAGDTKHETGCVSKKTKVTAWHHIKITRACTHCVLGVQCTVLYRSKLDPSYQKSGPRLSWASLYSAHLEAPRVNDQPPVSPKTRYTSTLCCHRVKQEKLTRAGQKRCEVDGYAAQTISPGTVVNPPARLPTFI